MDVKKWMEGDENRVWDVRWVS